MLFRLPKSGRSPAETLRNIKLILEYDGAGFSGFQKQPHRSTVQAALEQALSKFFNRKMKISAASGRTDAGVHALHQVVNFKTNIVRPAEKIRRGLNAHLPPGVAVMLAEEVGPKFHARFDARSKTYEYLVWNHPARTPLLAGRTFHVPEPLNLMRMRAAAKVLIGKHNFRSFCVTSSARENTVRTLKKFEIKKEGPLLRFCVEADGFLHHMVRNLVGTLLDAGRGKLSQKDLQAILSAKDRRKAGATVPAQGLILLNVTY